MYKYCRGCFIEKEYLCTYTASVYTNVVGTAGNALIREGFLSGSLFRGTWLCTQLYVLGMSVGVLTTEESKVSNFLLHLHVPQG